MGSQQGKGKRQRKPKKSAGVNGATKHPLTTIEKVLLGKGLFQSWTPIGRAER